MQFIKNIGLKWRSLTATSQMRSYLRGGWSGSALWVLRKAQAEGVRINLTSEEISHLFALTAEQSFSTPENRDDQIAILELAAQNADTLPKLDPALITGLCFRCVYYGGGEQIKRVLELTSDIPDYHDTLSTALAKKFREASYASTSVVLLENSEVFGLLRTKLSSNDIAEVALRALRNHEPSSVSKIVEATRDFPDLQMAMAEMIEREYRQAVSDGKAYEGESILENIGQYEALKERLAGVVANVALEKIENGDMRGFHGLLSQAQRYPFLRGDLPQILADNFTWENGPDILSHTAPYPFARDHLAQPVTSMYREALNINFAMVQFILHNIKDEPHLWRHFNADDIAEGFATTFRADFFFTTASLILEQTADKPHLRLKLPAVMAEAYKTAILDLRSNDAEKILRLAVEHPELRSNLPAGSERAASALLDRGCSRRVQAEIDQALKNLTIRFADRPDILQQLPQNPLEARSRFTEAAYGILREHRFQYPWLRAPQGPQTIFG